MATLPHNKGKQAMNSGTSALPNICEIAKLYAPDLQAVERAKRSQAALFKGLKPEELPLLLNAPLTKEQESLIPNPDFKDAFDDQALMVCQQLRYALSAANAKAGSVPSIRANFGTGILLACVGLEQDVSHDKMPWLQRHLTKEEISKLSPDDIKASGSYAKGLDCMRYFKSVLGERMPVYCMDTQGPFDLAHLMIGDDIFMELYDDPPFVHHLMELCLALGIKTHEEMKRISGEPHGAHFHSGMLYAENMGIRICEDTTTLISPEAIAEFAMPYTARLAKHFGGAWVHYCGRNDHLTKAICEIPDIRGINFGHIPGREHDHPFEQDMELIKAHGKVYVGEWPRRPNEDGKSFLRRMHGWAAQGALIPSGNPAVKKDAGLFASTDEALEFWRGL